MGAETQTRKDERSIHDVVSENFMSKCMCVHVCVCARARASARAYMHVGVG